MLIKIAKKTNIRPGAVQFVRLENWEISILNVNGSYCFYVKEYRLADTENTESVPSEEISAGDGAGDGPHRPKLTLSKPEVVIREDDICILINE